MYGFIRTWRAMMAGILSYTSGIPLDGRVGALIMMQQSIYNKSTKVLVFPAVAQKSNPHHQMDYRSETATTEIAPHVTGKETTRYLFYMPSSVRKV